MNYNLMEQNWETVKLAFATMQEDKLISNDSLIKVKDFCREMGSLLQGISELLPKQIYGRSAKKTVNGYEWDENGDYISFRGMFGEIWYRPKNYKPQGAGITPKHIAPFD